MSKHPATKKQSSDTPRLELLLGIFGLVLLVAAVAYLGYQGLSNPASPGAVTVTVLDVHPAGDAYVVKFSAKNEGGENLSQLHLTARLSEGNEEIESAAALIDYLPAHAERGGGIYLRNDPRRYTLRIDPAGYVEP